MHGQTDLHRLSSSSIVSCLKQSLGRSSSSRRTTRIPGWITGGGEGGMEHHLGNLSELWKSPRGTVVRIEVLALVAIALSFFYVAFGSSRRWSNHWMVQKGVLVANALSLSLGTYSIGLMQSSSVKSEMYPIWAVSLLTLFGSIDSISGYNLDHNSQFLKLLYQLCLYCGYVLLIGISTISTDVGNIAIGVLCAITFIKGFHRSLASVLPSRLRNVNKLIADYMGESHSRSHDGDVIMRDYPKYVVDWPLDHFRKRNNILEGNKGCLLQRRFFGFACAESRLDETEDFVNKGLLVQRDDGTVDYERAFNVIEVELYFLYDIFFTNNAFLHYYESKVATIWTFASIIGIIFVGVVTIIPGARTTHISGDTIVVTTTSYDLVITLVILVSIALLQVMQLVRCWTSNWSKVALVCQSIRNGDGGCQMRFKAFMTKINFFAGYVWQRKLGQYSFVEAISTKECVLATFVKRAFKECITFSRIFGLRYIEQVYEEMFGSPTGNHVLLTAHVKEAIVDSYMRLCLIDNGDLGTWSWTWPTIGVFSERKNGPRTIMACHIATCYLEMGQSKNKKWLDEHPVEEEREKLAVYFDVATTLSKYYAHLIVSAPQLLPPNPLETKSAYSAAAREARHLLRGAEDKYEAMKHMDSTTGVITNEEESDFSKEESVFRKGMDLGRSLENQPVFVLWEELARFWANRLLYAAPSDNVKEHIDHLSRGGEFITHLWALLFHAGIVNADQFEQKQAGRVQMRVMKLRTKIKSS
uniref:DUF4220 domain-containing protein n=1 Tax=Triticum aestivum TaxID=4565 RepID=A0A3B6H7C5_WHEAT